MESESRGSLFRLRRGGHCPSEGANRRSALLDRDQEVALRIHGQDLSRRLTEDRAGFQVQDGVADRQDAARPVPLPVGDAEHAPFPRRVRVLEEEAGGALAGAGAQQEQPGPLDRQRLQLPSGRV